jgi:hypothetical protein
MAMNTRTDRTRAVAALVVVAVLTVSSACGNSSATQSGSAVPTGGASSVPQASASAGTSTGRMSLVFPGISPYLVGNNVWAYPDATVWDVSGKAGLKIMRIGGNEWQSNLPDNDVLTDWVNHIKAMGAEPMLQVPSQATPEFAGALVRYFNQETGNTVRLWNIGNETHCNNDGAASAAEMADYIKPLASAMKESDPSIRIFAPDECDWYDVMYDSLLGGESDITGKDASGRYYIDGVSWHRYVSGDLATAGAEDIIARMVKTRTRIDSANKLHGRTGEDALQWGIGEFNAGKGEEVCTFANGQMFAQVYGAMMKYGGIYGETWSLFENGGYCSGTDFSFINYDKTPRSSYYHMQMVSQNFSGIYLDATKNLDGIRAYGALDVKAGKVSVMLMNVDGAKHDCTISLSTDPIAAGECKVNVPAKIAAAIPQTIAAHSTIVLVFDLQGKLTRTITYSDGMTAPEVK